MYRVQPDSGLAVDLPLWASKSIAVVAALGVLGALVLVSGYDWELFTTTTMLLSVAISWAIFGVTWSARRYRVNDNSFYFVLGVSLFAVSLLNVITVLAARRVDVVGLPGDEVGARLWLLARWLQSSTVLVAVALLYARQRRFQRNPLFPYLVLASYGIATLALIVVGFCGILPVCTVDDLGYTSFFRFAEAGSAALLTISLLQLWRKRNQLDAEILRWLLASLVGMLCTDVALALPSHRLTLLLAHLFVVSGAFALYRATIATAIRNPQLVLFRALAQSEAQYRSLVEHTPDILLRLDRQCHVLFANAAIARLVPPSGSLEALPGLLRHGFADGNGATCDRSLFRAFDTGQVQLDTLTWHGGSHPAIYEVRMVPEVGADGGVATVLCMLRDVTAQRAIERDYKLLFDATPAGFVVLKVLYDDRGQPSDYRGLAINAAAARIFHDVLSRMESDLSLRGALADDSAFGVLARVALTGVSEQFEMELDDEDKHLAVALYAPEPGILACIAVDISERVHAQAKLQQTLTALEKSNSDLERFVYVASHDLQEPLRMVTAYTQLLADRYEDILDSEANEFIGYALEGAQRSRALIQDLLAYARVTSEGRSLQPTAAGKALERVIARLAPTIEESGATIFVDWLPLVTVDAAQLEQLFEHLLSNAIKYRSDAPPRIHISAERAGDEWAFAVSDNGLGIDPAYQERIFVIFQRLHARAEYPGTGIGLAICQNIVRRHGGRIWVESEVGQGATFRFTLPILPIVT